jgi:hypothetical protein
MPRTPPPAVAMKDSIAAVPPSAADSSWRSAGVAPSDATRVSACGRRSASRIARVPARATSSGRRTIARRAKRRCAGIQRPACGAHSGETEC